MINVYLDSHCLIVLLHLWDTVEYTDLTYRKYHWPVSNNLTRPAKYKEQIS